MRTRTETPAPEIRPGMRVVDAEGVPVGRVLHVASDGFLIQGRGFLPPEYVAGDEDVRRVRGSEVELAGTVGDLSRWDPPGESVRPAEDSALHVDADFRMRLHEEELVPETHLRPIGRVRVVKEVKTEYRTVTVPVRREELRIERLPA